MKTLISFILYLICASAWPQCSPILIDTRRDGIELGPAGRGVSFDVNADGFPDHVQWVRRGGDEAFQVAMHDTREGRIWRLTTGTARNHAPRWSNSGRLLAWSSTARNGRDMDIHVIEPERPRSARLLAEVEGLGLVADWSPDELQNLATSLTRLNTSLNASLDASAAAESRS